jgi:hypothetical protein
MPLPRERTEIHDAQQPLDSGASGLSAREAEARIHIPVVFASHARNNMLQAVKPE